MLAYVFFKAQGITTKNKITHWPHFVMIKEIVTYFF